MYKVKLMITDKSFKIHIFLNGSIDPLSFTYPVQSHSGTATYPRCHCNLSQVSQGERWESPWTQVLHIWLYHVYL